MADKKEGVSIKEIESFAKNHRFEVFFCLLFLLACLSGLFEIVFKTRWNILLLFAGAILSIFMPKSVDGLLKKTFQFVFRQDKTIQMVFGIVSLIIALFFPIAIFFLLGVAGGYFLYQKANESMIPKG